MSNSVRERFFTSASRIRNLVAPGALILMYHRIAEAPSDPWSLCVTPDHFAEHLQVFRNYGRSSSLKELTEALGDGRKTSRRVVLTFDDGYADNLIYGLPILERFDFPATIFVVSGNIGSHEEFWWDVLEHMLLYPGKLPSALQLRLDEKEFQWYLGDSAEYDEESFNRDRSWKAESQAVPSERQALYKALHSLLRSMPTRERRKVLSQLREWSRRAKVFRPENRSLAEDEILAVERGGLVEIGSHTVNHPMLALRAPTEQIEEIQKSKAALEEIIGKPVKSFSYPFGSYANETLGAVKQAGYACACSTIFNSVWRPSDTYQLPRIEIKDWDGEDLQRQLSRWLWD